MIGWRSLLVATLRARPMLNRKILPPMWIQKHGSSHSEGPPQPFDNLPFSPPSPYMFTFFFALTFGVGLWTPWVIVWYMMAKSSL